MVEMSEDGLVMAGSGASEGWRQVVVETMGRGRRGNGQERERR